ncbi:MAG: hypothetical protein VCC20_14800, partial [Myxococcota bacterium]
MDSAFFSDLLGNLSELGEVAVLLAVAVVAYLVTRFWIVGLIRRLVGRSKTTWDDALVRSQVFLRLAHFAPAMVAFYGITFIPDLSPALAQMIQRASVAVMLTVAALSAGAVLTALNEIYSQDPENRQRSIKGYLQVVKMGIYILAAISIISVLLDKS